MLEDMSLMETPPARELAKALELARRARQQGSPALAVDLAMASMGKAVESGTVFSTEALELILEATDERGEGKGLGGKAVTHLIGGIFPARKSPPERFLKALEQWVQHPRRRQMQNLTEAAATLNWPRGELLVRRLVWEREPTNRDNALALVRLATSLGELTRASQVATRWLDQNPLDDAMRELEREAAVTEAWQGDGWQAKPGS